jgi:hypothetical protein
MNKSLISVSTLILVFFISFTPVSQASLNWGVTPDEEFQWKVIFVEENYESEISIGDSMKLRVHSSLPTQYSDLNTTNYILYEESTLYNYFREIVSYFIIPVTYITSDGNIVDFVQSAKDILENKYSITVDYGDNGVLIRYVETNEVNLNLLIVELVEIESKRIHIMNGAIFLSFIAIIPIIHKLRK